MRLENDQEMIKPVQVQLAPENDKINFTYISASVGEGMRGVAHITQPTQIAAAIGVAQITQPTQSLRAQRQLSTRDKDQHE